MDKHTTRVDEHTTVGKRTTRVDEHTTVGERTTHMDEHTTRRGGGGEEWGGDACVAPGVVEPTHRNQGDASVPTGQRERKNNLDSRTI